MSDLARYTEQNRRAWNEIADQRERVRRALDASFFAAEKTSLHAVELDALGDLRGQRALHLACASGGDTLSLAVLGADVVGVDISDAAISIAKAKSADTGLSARFIRADLFDLPPDLQAANFDLVFASSGCLAWIPDLTRWATIVAAALRMGGRLVLHELHPAMIALEVVDGVLTPSNYFGRDEPSVENGPLTGVNCTEIRYDFLWPLGDVVTSAVRAGLQVVRLEESPPDPASHWAERFGDHLESLLQFPASFLLVAERSLSSQQGAVWNDEH